MAKKFLNGYKEFSIEARNPVGVLIKKYTFRKNYQVMKEYSEEHFKQTTVKGGKILQKFKYLYYYYTIGYQDRLEAEEGLKFKEILNHEIIGNTIILIPHIDAPVRYDKVITQKSSGVTDKIELSLMPMTSYSKGNQGFVLNLQSSEPWNHINWIDSDTVNTVSRVSLDVIR